MPTTRQLNITLPDDMAGVILSKVRSGQYADESEVVRDSLYALLERERSIEHWLHAEVGPAWDALKADPARAVTAAQIRARLAAEHARMQ